MEEVSIGVPDIKPTWAEEKGTGGWQWSPRETQYVRDNADSASAEDMAVVLGRTVLSIRTKARNLGTSLSKHRDWTSDDDAFLCKNAGNVGIEELADKLGCSSPTIRRRAFKLRLSVAAPCVICGRKFKTISKASKAKGNNRACCDGCSPMYKVVMSTVRGHHYLIFKDQHPSYNGMPFFDDWNPDKNGSFLAAVKWIIKNLGPRPKGSTLHVIPQTKKGFAPDNLVWTSPREQTNQQMYKIIGRQDHRIKQLEAEVHELTVRLSSKVEPEELYLKQVA